VLPEVTWNGSENSLSNSYHLRPPSALARLTPGPPESKRLVLTMSSLMSFKACVANVGFLDLQAGLYSDKMLWLKMLCQDLPEASESSLEASTANC